ncbi:MAG: pantoate--beta-alanine ligase [Bacteroidota bacterium]|nr:pantoate--beta-alanine ligase [Bacteroidota bacterium]
MLILKKIEAVENHLKQLKKRNLKIGFVPTMGALHAGHISLIESSRQQCEVNVCSIFVNPTQFNDKNDFDNYPTTLDKDIEMLNDVGCDVLFLPSVKEMYPEGFVNKNKVDFGFLAKTLEGEHRPGHFDGMAQIVEKLLRIVKPDKLFMGQKDYQQQLIVSKLIKKLKLKTVLVISPTLREKDGLAMSSRNVRLNPEARKLAVEISRTLKGVKAAIHHPKSNIQQVQEWGGKRLSGFKGIETEYFEIRNADTLEPVDLKSKKLVALVAAKIGGVRLIDNMVLN